MVFVTIGVSAQELLGIGRIMNFMSLPIYYGIWDHYQWDIDDLGISL